MGGFLPNKDKRRALIVAEAKRRGVKCKDIKPLPPGSTLGEVYKLQAKIWRTVCTHVDRYAAVPCYITPDGKPRLPRHVATDLPGLDEVLERGKPWDPKVRYRVRHSNGLHAGVVLIPNRKLIPYGGERPENRRPDGDLIMRSAARLVEVATGAELDPCRLYLHPALTYGCMELRVPLARLLAKAYSTVVITYRARLSIETYVHIPHDESPALHTDWDEPHGWEKLYL